MSPSQASTGTARRGAAGTVRPRPAAARTQLAWARRGVLLRAVPPLGVLLLGLVVLLPGHRVARAGGPAGGGAAPGPAQAPVQAPAPAFLEGGAWLGLSEVPLVPVGTAHEPEVRARIAALAGLPSPWAETQPIRWGDLEPRPPTSLLAGYDWRALDATVAALHAAGCLPRLVLSPECGWAGLPAAQAPYAAFVQERLPSAEAQAALQAAGGALPPRPDAWAAWQRLVREVVERYDGDGLQDMPGLLRPVLELQVLDQLQPATRWRGDLGQYQRLLDAARGAARDAHPLARVAHAALDPAALLRAGEGQPSRWPERLRAAVPALPALARLEAQRGLEMLLQALAWPDLADAFPVLGSASLAEDQRNLAACREALGPAGAAVPLWLVQGPMRRLGSGRVALPGEQVPAEEARRREVRLAAALREGEEGAARRWLRTGTAFDLVRGAVLARAAGATRVLTVGLDDLPRRVPGEEQAHLRLQGLVRPVAAPGAAAAYGPTPAWHALQQLHRLTLGHRDAALAPLGGPGQVVVFSFGGSQERPWVAVLLPDPLQAWAPMAGEREATRTVRVPLPRGRVEVEEVALDHGAPRRRSLEVGDGLLEVELGSAPVYVLAEGGRR